MRDKSQCCWDCDPLLLTKSIIVLNEREREKSQKGKKAIISLYTEKRSTIEIETTKIKRQIHWALQDQFHTKHIWNSSFYVRS